MIEIIPPRSIKDIRDIVYLYNNVGYDEYFTYDLEKAIYKTELMWKMGSFIRLYIEDNEILGFIIADIVDLIHLKDCVYKQLWYASRCKGFKAAKVVKKLHEALIEEAENKKVGLVLSTGSHLDEDNTFTKLLERFGWLRHGHTAFWKTKYYKE